MSRFSTGAATALFGLSSCAFGQQFYIFTVAGNHTFGYSGDGGPAVSAQFRYVTGVALDALGNFYVTDSGCSCVRKVGVDGIVGTIAGTGVAGYSGDGGQAVNAQLRSPSGIAVDGFGNIYVSDSVANNVRKITPNGAISTVAGGGSNNPANGGLATSAALSDPQGLATDGANNLYIADAGSHRVLKVAVNGTISRVVGVGGPGECCEGYPAASAQLGRPVAVALDAAGTLYFAESQNRRVCKIDADGKLKTIAGTSYLGGPLGFHGLVAVNLSSPAGVGVDAAGNAYISDSTDRKLYAITPGGAALTIAGTGAGGYSGDGGPATSATIDSPRALTLDPAGRIYLADFGNAVVRLLTTQGPLPALTIGSTYPASARAGQRGLQYSVIVSNGARAGATTGAVTLSVALSGGLSLASMSGAGWSCAGASCVRGDPLIPGANYPQVTVTVDVSSSAPSPVTAQISVTGGGSTTASASAVTYVTPPEIFPSGIRNAASFGPGAVAPGSIVAAFGDFPVSSPLSALNLPLPTDLDGLYLLAGGVMPPLFYASSGQVNLQVPWELAGRTLASVTATGAGRTSHSESLNLAPFAPGIFTTNSQGTGQGAIQDVSYRLVDPTNPATPGSVVVIYCTGLGAVTNQPASGVGAPAYPYPLAETTTRPAVTIGGAPATVLFSGLVPGLVGEYQVNAVVPAASATGSAVPVVISIGGVTSNTATIAVAARH